MFKNKKIVLFLLVLPLVAVLVAPKVALADDDSDWVKNIPIIGGVVDFASDPGGWITDRFAEGAEFFFNDGLQNIKTTSTKSILGKSFNNLLGKKTGTFYSTVSFVNKSVVMPTAASILSLVMLIQLIIISQRIDGTATLPAIKDIVFLIIYATIFIWLLKNSLKICAGAYDLFNEMIGKINQSTVDELKTVTIADSCKESFGAVIGIWVQSMIFDLITIIIKGSVSVMCYMRAMQLYVMAAFSPLPFLPCRSQRYRAPCLRMDRQRTEHAAEIPLLPRYRRSSQRPRMEYHRGGLGTRCSRRMGHLLFHHTSRI